MVNRTRVIFGVVFAVTIIFIVIAVPFGLKLNKDRKLNRELNKVTVDYDIDEGGDMTPNTNFKTT